MDISCGLMVADTSFLGWCCTVPVAHKIVQTGVQLYRFQGELAEDGYSGVEVRRPWVP